MALVQKRPLQINGESFLLGGGGVGGGVRRGSSGAILIVAVGGASEIYEVFEVVVNEEEKEPFTN